MRLPHPLARPSWPRRTARLRLTALYGGLFLLCGVVLVAITYLLVKHAIERGPGVNGLPLDTYHLSFSTHGSAPEILLRKGPLRRILAAAARQQIAFDLHQLLVKSASPWVSSQ